jgi:hypothetical protein
VLNDEAAIAIDAEDADVAVQSDSLVRSDLPILQVFARKKGAGAKLQAHVRVALVGERIDVDQVCALNFSNLFANILKGETVPRVRTRQRFRGSFQYAKRLCRGRGWR